MTLEEIATHIVDAALGVHRRMGPGMLESAYEAILEHELRKRGLKVERQLYLDLEFDGLHVERAFCVDLMVNRSIIIEVKSIDALTAVHTKQVVTYLKLTNLQLGFLINFSQITLKAGGIRRVVNRYNPQT